MSKRALALPLSLLLVGASCRDGGSNATARTEIVVFAASSLQDVLAEIAPRFQDESGIAVAFNFGGSNALALQAEASRQADVFLSASEEWMDHVEASGLVVPGSRRPFLSNRLVIIASHASTIQLTRPEEIATAPFRFLSLADPEAVPAGQYAKQYLESVGVDGGSAWSRVKDRVVPALDPRAAMALVEAQPDILGIVYRTDAATSETVRVLIEVPEGKGPKIRYSAAALRGPGDPAGAERFLSFLASAEATHVFVANGFIVLDDGIR